MRTARAKAQSQPVPPTDFENYQMDLSIRVSAVLAVVRLLHDALPGYTLAMGNGLMACDALLKDLDAKLSAGPQKRASSD